MRTGANREGIAPLADTARGSEPLSRITCSPVSIFEAIQKNGIGILLKSRISPKCIVRPEIKL